MPRYDVKVYTEYSRTFRVEAADAQEAKAVVEQHEADGEHAVRADPRIMHVSEPEFVGGEILVGTLDGEERGEEGDAAGLTDRERLAGVQHHLSARHPLVDRAHAPAGAARSAPRARADRLAAPAAGGTGEVRGRAGGGTMAADGAGRGPDDPAAAPAPGGCRGRWWFPRGERCQSHLVDQRHRSCHVHL